MFSVIDLLYIITIIFCVINIFCMIGIKNNKCHVLCDIIIGICFAISSFIDGLLIFAILFTIFAIIDSIIFYLNKEQ